jgi:hypothetical protein
MLSKIGKSTLFDSCTARSIRAAFARFDVFAAGVDDIAEARDFAGRLIGGQMADTSTIARIHQKTDRATLFLARDGEELTGVIAFLLLSEQGLEAILAERFNGLDPDPSHIAGDGAPLAAVYNWTIAASRNRAVKRLIDGYEAMRRQAVPRLTFYSRPVTEAGWRLTVDRLKYKPLAGSTIGLVWSAPLPAQATEMAA